ncbi:MAG TPA: hypothetical protein VG188_11325 [Solirubrobacteraceae bacterium]|jgi:hypothetical protein|nr:hypothetical protein [Solirubrobacteraceae bacterium]
MAVRADHLAPLDLVEYRLPFVAADADGDAEALAPDVVELEDQRVGLSAVGARPLAEELDEVGRALGDQRVLSTRRIGNVKLAMGRIVLLYVRSPTWATVVVALAFVFRR